MWDLRSDYPKSNTDPVIHLGKLSLVYSSSLHGLNSLGTSGKES